MNNIDIVAEKMIRIFNENDIYDYQKLKYLLSPIWYDFAEYSVYNPFEKAYENYLSFILNLDKYNRLISNSNFAPYWCFNADCVYCNKKHQYLHKKVILYSDPIWNKIYPPNDWDCGCYIDCYTKKEIIERKFIIFEGNEIDVSKLNSDFLKKLNFNEWQLLYKKYLINHFKTLKKEIESEEE